MEYGDEISWYIDCCDSVSFLLFLFDDLIINPFWTRCIRCAPFSKSVFLFQLCFWCTMPGYHGLDDASYAETLRLVQPDHCGDDEYYIQSVDYGQYVSIKNESVDDPQHFGICVGNGGETTMGVLKCVSIIHIISVFD